MGSLKHYETVRDSLVCYDLFILFVIFTRNSERLAYLLRSMIRNQEFHIMLFASNFGMESGISHYVIYV